MDDDEPLDRDNWAMEPKRMESSLVRDLTLMLLYLTSWDDGGIGGTRRCWKTFRSEVLGELMTLGFVQGRHAKTISLSESGEEEAQLLLDRYGFDILPGSPLTLREIRSAVSRLPDAEREELIRDLLNHELMRAEGKDESCL
ncbi:MAG TPA: hypothetical protein VD969_10040 [Symbiobacteriaceae bacterium]|nr:hypothetical protein [Symbiobacteriaceae bacterium]